MEKGSSRGTSSAAYSTRAEGPTKKERATATSPAAYSTHVTLLLLRVGGTDVLQRCSCASARRVWGLPVQGVPGIRGAYPLLLC